MDDVFIYTVDLPVGINEMVTVCNDGYTVYLAARLSGKERLAAFEHALKHIKNGDFDKSDADKIEYYAHVDTEN